MREMRICTYEKCDVSFEVRVVEIKRFCSKKCANRSSSRKGKTYVDIYGDKAEEVAKKISESTTGKIVSEETKEKQRKAKLGTKQSEECVRKRLETRKITVGLFIVRK